MSQGMTMGKNNLYTKSAAVLLLLAVMLLAGGCHDLNNPLDPEAESYQGFNTVASADEVGPDTPGNGEDSYYQIFYASELYGSEGVPYTFTIDDSSDFSDPFLYNSAEVDGNVLAVDLDLEESADGNYYFWTAHITDSSGGTGDVSAFTACGVDPLSPGALGSTYDTTPTFSWESVDNADYYELQIGINNSSISENTPYTPASSEYSVTDILSYGDTLYWRARPVDQDDDYGDIYGYWNTVQSFYIDWNYSFTNMDPPDWSTVYGGSVTLSWDPIEGASRYQVQIAEYESSLSSYQYTTINTYYVPASPPEDGFYWRVRPVNEDGVAGLSWSDTYYCYLSSQYFYDSFESYSDGDVPDDWAGELFYKWKVDAYDAYYDGNKSLQSADIIDGGSSKIWVDVSCDSYATVSFYYKVSSESGYDYLCFYIDNVQMGSWSGEIYWNLASYSLSSGDHTLKWEYYKDSSQSDGDDCAWIDLVVVE